MLRVGPVMVTAGAIAALSFFSLTVFATATVRNFGLLTGFGIISALVIELTLIPALRLMLPAPRAAEMAREARAGRFLESGLARLSRLVSERPALVAAGALAISGCALLAETRLRVEELPPIGEGVGGDVQDPHDVGAGGKIIAPGSQPVCKGAGEGRPVGCRLCGHRN
jgi:uncharacterized membrane protein YdfJ with MMPL/SSD domain